MGEIDFSANLQLLEFARTSIGVAPLETAGDGETLDFVAGKSDLKMLLFDGYGHPGVYSNSPPYGDSPFRKGATVIGNSYREWSDALEHVYQEGWRSASERSQWIAKERHIDRVAKESWFPALEAAIIPKPVSGRHLFEAFRSSLEMRNTAASNIGYLVANLDVARNWVSDIHSAWDHFEAHGRHEGRHICHTPAALEDFVLTLDREFEEVAERLRMRQDEANERLANKEALRASQAEIASLQESIAEVPRLQDEISALRNSLSWKITSPLRRLAKPLMVGNRQST
jgi:hypothetical protein